MTITLFEQLNAINFEVHWWIFIALKFKNQKKKLRRKIFLKNIFFSFSSKYLFKFSFVLLTFSLVGNFCLLLVTPKEFVLLFDFRLNLKKKYFHTSTSLCGCAGRAKSHTKCCDWRQDFAFFFGYWISHRSLKIYKILVASVTRRHVAYFLRLWNALYSIRVEFSGH